MTTLLPNVAAAPKRSSPYDPIGEKEFRIGTTGWRASDLDDPQWEALWNAGRYEIINGVLTEMAAASFDNSSKMMRLQAELFLHTRGHKIAGDYAPECEVVIDDDRLVKADMVWMAAADIARHRRQAIERGKTPLERARVMIPPTLALESVSYGHERHDRVTKFNWYAEFGIGHYWIFDALKRTLDCYVLEDGKYRLAARGEGDQSVAVPLFDGLTIDLAPIWRD